MQVDSSLSPATRDFIENCLKVHEKDRFSWDEVFTHKIFDGFFQQYAEQNKKFENKLKMVMSDLRFQINSRNLDLRRLLDSLGFKGNHELTFQ